jgi:hypothetical protein
MSSEPNDYQPQIEKINKRIDGIQTEIDAIKIATQNTIQPILDKQNQISSPSGTSSNSSLPPKPWYKFWNGGNYGVKYGGKRRKTKKTKSRRTMRTKKQTRKK